ncbi:STAS domain-containing protein [Glycomyces arizonensis]|uniref:STAS domain-containing protein n=1 Tax=Glycomyces arizonensis TaxID=256035 RepID=UPI000A02EA6B|nr:STAS domain-containing protein [Glycomyces arizonensis]
MSEHPADEQPMAHSTPMSRPYIERADPDIADKRLWITECDCVAPGLRVSGEIDLNGHNDWEIALREVTGRGEQAHLDLTELTFIDVRGVTLLVDAAGRAGAGQRILVYGAPPSLHRVLQVLWPDKADAIRIKGDQ